MKKTILIISSMFSSLTLLPLTSISCQNKENKIKEIKKNLNSYAKNEFDLKIDTTKYTLDEAKNINNYQYKLKENYIFKLKEIKTIDNKIVVKYTILDQKNNVESDEFTKEFSNFKQKNIDKFDESKYNELFSLFNLDKTKLPSENINNFSNDKSNDNFKDLNVKVLEYDDSTGKIKISITGTYKNIPFELKEFTINDFKALNKNLTISNVQGKLNIQKMIEDNKTINDIKNLNGGELIKYFSELYGYDNNNEKIDLLGLLRNKNYKLDIFKIISKNNQYLFNITLTFSYKKFNGNSTEEVKKTIVEQNSRIIDKVSYTDNDIVNYLASKLVRKNNMPEYEYASAYRANFWRRKLFSSPSFLELINKEKYKQQFNLSEIQLKDLSVSANDIEGKLHISYQLIMHKKNNDTIPSNVFKTTISGFKKIDVNFLKKNFFISEKDPTNERWKKYAKEIKNKYDLLSDEQKSNYEIVDEMLKAKYFGYSIGNNIWNVMRQRNFRNAEPNEIRENNTWNFVYRNKGNTFKDAFFENQNWITEKEGKQFQINNIDIKFKKISNFRYENNRFKFDYIFEISFAINNGSNPNSESEEIIKFDFAFTQYLNI